MYQSVLAPTGLRADSALTRGAGNMYILLVAIFLVTAAVSDGDKKFHLKTGAKIELNETDTLKLKAKSDTVFLEYKHRF